MANRFPFRPKRFHRAWELRLSGYRGHARGIRVAGVFTDLQHFQVCMVQSCAHTIALPASTRRTAGECVLNCTGCASLTREHENRAASPHGVYMRWLVQKYSSSRGGRPEAPPTRPSPIVALYSSRLDGIVTDPSLMTGLVVVVSSLLAVWISRRANSSRALFGACFGLSLMLPPSMTPPCIPRRRRSAGTRTVWAGGLCNLYGEKWRGAWYGCGWATAGGQGSWHRRG